MKRIFGSALPKEVAPVHITFDAPLRPDLRIAVIGDVHGRADLLDALLDQLMQEDNFDEVIFVGDLVDRGDHSQQVLSRMMQLTSEAPMVRCLMGNHEKMLLDFIDRPRERGLRWLRNGGLQTLASFGFHNLRDSMSEDDMEAASADFRRVLPAGMEDWIRALPLTYRTGNVWVVHAAADPNVALDQQSSRTLLWGNRKFTQQNRADGQWVVHGHTIVDRPIAGDGRISIDTGAYATGHLTAVLVTQDSAPRFIHT